VLEQETKHRHTLIWTKYNGLYCSECGEELTFEEALKALASCEQCGKQFEQNDSTCYYEMYYYSYCGACCNF
jgi:transcription initiation factor IIE alpha subunit